MGEDELKRTTGSREVTPVSVMPLAFAVAVSMAMVYLPSPERLLRVRV